MKRKPSVSGASILTLPIETRFMIYDLILTFTGSLVVFSQYELIKNVDKQTMKLLHVNRLIRTEVHEYFYKNQKFQFRSFPAMNKFLDKIGPYYSSIIKKVEIGSWLAQRAQFAEQIRPLLQKLTGIDQFAIIAPAHGFVTHWSEEGELGSKAVAVIGASERLAAGKLYVAWPYDHDCGEVRFVAKDVQYPTEEDFTFYMCHRAILREPSKWVHHAEIEISGYLWQVGESQDSEIEKKTTGVKLCQTGSSSAIVYLEGDDDENYFEDYQGQATTGGVKSGSDSSYTEDR